MICIRLPNLLHIVPIIRCCTFSSTTPCLVTLHTSLYSFIYPTLQPSLHRSLPQFLISLFIDPYTLLSFSSSSPPSCPPPTLHWSTPLILSMFQYISSSFHQYLPPSRIDVCIRDARVKHFCYSIRIRNTGLSSEPGYEMDAGEPAGIAYTI